MVILLLAGLILFGGGYRYALLKERAAVENAPHWENQAEVTEKEIQVHVTGAVERPGVYKLTQGARIVEAINLAGLSEDADLDALRLAAVLNDGQTINVPSIVPGDGQGGTAQITGAAAINDSLININNADSKQLCTLPGIGPALAERIIAYRETKGQFSDVSEIKKVTGIGDKKFQDLQDKITVY